MNKVVGTSLTYWLWFNYNSQFIIFLLLVQTAISEKKNEPGTSSAAMFSHYTAIKIKNKCYQFFFFQVIQMQPVSFSLKQRINFSKTVYRIFFHSRSALNNKDLIILTFITIAG